MVRVLLAALVLAAAARARAGPDEDKADWIRRQDQAQFSGDGNNRLLPPVKNGALQYKKKSEETAPAVSRTAPPRPDAPPSGAARAAGVGDAASGGGGGGASGDSARERQATAMSKASKIASQLKAASPEADGLGAAGSRPDQAGRSAPAGTRTFGDLIAAEQPFNASFKSAGLRVGTSVDGRPLIVDAAGRPATPAQLASLRQAIAAEPRALMRRPDFYQVLPRSDFQALKGAYVAAEGSMDPRFLHIGLTEPPRDFVWTQSCREVSGNCNALAREKSYDKGAEVSPETLAAVAKSIKDGDDDDNDSLWAEYVRVHKQEDAADRERAAKRKSGAAWGAGAAGLLDRMAGWARALGWGVEDAAGASSADGRSPGADAGGAERPAGAAAAADGGAGAGEEGTSPLRLPASSRTAVAGLGALLGLVSLLALMRAARRRS